MVRVKSVDERGQHRSLGAGPIRRYLGDVQTVLWLTAFLLVPCVGYFVCKFASEVPPLGILIAVVLIGLAVTYLEAGRLSDDAKFAVVATGAAAVAASALVGLARPRTPGPIVARARMRRSH